MKFIHLSSILIVTLLGFNSPSNVPMLQPANQNVKQKPVEEIFSYIRCHRQAKNIVVNWGVSSTAGIDYFLIYHSEDNDFYDDIAPMPVANTEKYSFKHLSVFPGYHYYKIAAVMLDGTTVWSGIDVVRIVSRG